MSDNYLLYDPAAFGALEIKEDTRDAEILRLRAENEKLAQLSAKASQEASQLRAALKPFKEVAEHDIGDDEADADLFRPITPKYSRAPLLTVGDLRAAAAALKETRDE